MATNSTKPLNGPTCLSGAHGGYPVVGAPKSASRRFLDVIDRYRRVIIVAHNNPDPDAIATGWAIKTLLESRRSDVPVRFVASGQITRAENRHMVDRLQAPIELVDTKTFQKLLAADASTAMVLVDCGPAATHHLAASAGRSPTAVIDHHQCLPSKVERQALGTARLPSQIPFCDLRPDVAASASIAASYLQQQQLTPAWPLATALIYALKTETRGGENYFTALDRAMLHWLTAYADPAFLAEIEDAPLSRGYYLDLLVALQNTVIYGSTAFCLIPHADTAEIVGEVADLLIRCSDIHSVLCGTAIDSDVLVSVRADGIGGDATALIAQTLAGIGKGGGHRSRAGGKISDVCLGEGVPADIENELRQRWLAVNQCADQLPTRLVPGSELIQQLR